MAKKSKMIPINVWSVNDIKEFDLWLSNQEGMKEQISIAQIKELRAIIAKACFDSSNIVKLLLQCGEKLNKEGK